MLIETRAGKDRPNTPEHVVFVGPRRHRGAGGHGQDASALMAGLRVGANLAGMQQNLSYPTTFHLSPRLGTRDAYTTMMPGHPTFGFRGSAGINVGNVGFEEFIAVNQVGKRFFNEVRLPVRPSPSRYPGDGASPGRGLDHKPLDWRNSTGFQQG